VPLVKEGTLEEWAVDERADGVVACHNKKRAPRRFASQYVQTKSTRNVRTANDIVHPIHFSRVNGTFSRSEQ
jgi:hypothetical protein